MHPASFIKIIGGAGAIALATGCTCNGCPPDDWLDTSALMDTDTDVPEDTDATASDSTCTPQDSETARP